MNIVFVEDERKDVARVIDVLESTRYFKIRVVDDYSKLDSADLELVDLFVLDILIGGSDAEFAKFIRKLRKSRKPFIAFTTNSQHTRLRSFAGNPPPPVRQVVLEHGGLGLICKRKQHDDSPSKLLSDIQLDLAEMVLGYFWSKE